MSIGDIEKSGMYNISILEQSGNEESGLEITFRVSCSAKAMNDRTESILVERQKDFKLPGFRPGAVPISLIKREIGDGIESMIKEGVIESGISEILVAHSVIPILKPDIKIAPSNAGGDFVFEVKITTAPTIPEIQWAEHEVEVFERIPDPKTEIFIPLNTLRASSKQYKTLPEHAVTENDSVIADIEAEVGGKRYDELCAESLRIDLETSNILESIKHAIIGMRAGENKDVEVEMPNDIPNKKVAGVKIKFSISVKEVQVISYSEEINDAFAQKFKVKSVDELYQVIDMKAAQEFNALAMMLIKKRIMTLIDDIVKIHVNHKIVEGEAKSMKEQMEKREMTPLSDEKYRAIAEKKIKTMFVFDKIARVRGIDVTEDELKRARDLQILMNPDKKSNIEYLFSTPEYKNSLGAQVLEEKVMFLILNHAKKNVVRLTAREFAEKHGNEIRSF